ncbi:MAG: hypothetical protein ABUL62_05420 [Myxococcales bacterium]
MILARWPYAAPLWLRGITPAIALLAGASACSSSSPHPSLIASDGGASDGHSGGRSGSESSEAGTEAGGDAGTGGVAEGGTSSAGASADGAAGSPVKPGPSVCAQSATWSGAMPVAGVSTSAAESLLSVTADELDVAFLRAGALYVAHRSKASDPFTAGSAVVIPAGWSTQYGAALSSDGKRLLLVSDPDQKKLGELTRTTRSNAFAGEVDESAFSIVNQNAIYTGRIYASPVVSEQDDRLIFNSAYPEGASTIVVATRTDGAPWNAPTTLTPSLLDGLANQRRLPTGISADERTLFYFNEESSKEEARWSASSALGSPLYDMLSLGTRRGATPNSACDRLYSESDSDVVVETD